MDIRFDILRTTLYLFAGFAIGVYRANIKMRGARTKGEEWLADGNKFAILILTIYIVAKTVEIAIQTIINAL